MSASKFCNPLAVASLSLMIAACGGGGGGGNPGSGTPNPPTGGNPPPPPAQIPASLSLIPTSLSVFASLSGTAPTANFAAQITSNAAEGTQFYVSGSYSIEGIATISDSSGPIGSFTVQFKAPASLGAGTYTDTIIIKACYDMACTQQIQNSPQSLPVTYIVAETPALTSLSPSTVQANTAFTLTVNGTGFTNTSVVIFNGNPLSTNFVSATQLTVSITADQIAQPDPYTVVVAPSAALASQVLSNQLVLGVIALPAITSLSPSSIIAGSVGFPLTVNGSNLSPVSVVLWGGTPLQTTWVDNNQVTAMVGAAQLLTAGTVSVTVQSAADPTSPVSNAVPFNVQPLPALGVSSISPSTVILGGPGFKLTVLGQGFMPNAVVQLNGSALNTTYLSEGQLQAQISAGDIVAVGTAMITVQNGAAGTSSPLTLKINNSAPDAVGFQLNPAHSGATTFKTLSLPTTRAWSVNVGGTPSYAVIAEGKVVVTAQVGGGTQLVALDHATGATLWGPISLGGTANAVYDGGKIFVMSGSFNVPMLLQSYDLATGNLDWTTTLNGEAGLSAGPSALNGMIFASDASATLYAVNEGAGSIAWTQLVMNGDDSMPAVTNTGVYVTYPCSTYAFEPLTGDSLFFNNTGCEGGGGATPVVANNVLYSPNSGGASNSGTTFNATSGVILGTYIADVPPAVGTQMSFFLQSGTLSGIALSNNTVAWTFSGDGSLVTSPILVNQTVFIGSTSGNVYALNAATGQQLWSINAGGAIPPGAHWGAPMPLSALAAGDGLLVVPAGNTVVAYTLSTDP